MALKEETHSILSSYFRLDFLFEEVNPCSLDTIVAYAS